MRDESSATPESGGASTPANILGDIALSIYKPPLSEVRASGAIADLSRPLSVVMLLIDLETEVQMNGIENFIGNSTGLYANETVAALERIGSVTEAALLREIVAIAARVGMTHESIQAGQAHLAEFTVTSFGEVHGTKWTAAVQEIRRLCAKIDFALVMRHAEVFVARHRDALLKELGH